MSESTTHLSTNLKRKHVEEEVGSIKNEADRTTELVSAVIKKKSKLEEEKSSLNIELNVNQVNEVDNKLKPNNGINDQELKSVKDTPDNAANNSEKIPTNEQVPTDAPTNEENTANNAETNESAIEKIKLPNAEIVIETRGTEPCSKKQGGHNSVLAKTRETAEGANEAAKALPNVETVESQITPITEIVSTTVENESATNDDTCVENPDTNCYPQTQKEYIVLKEPKDSKSLKDILRHDEPKKLMAQIKPARILFPSSLSVTVKQITVTDDIKNADVPKIKCILPNITIVPIEKKTKDEEDNSKTNSCGEDDMNSIAGTNIASSTKIVSISSNAISTRKVPKQSNSAIYPTGIISKRMVVKNTSGDTLATIKTAIVGTQQLTPAPTATTSRKIITINKNKLTPISYKVRNCVLLPPLQSKPHTSDNDKPIITSVEYIRKNPALVKGSAVEKSIDSKSLNGEKARGVNLNDSNHNGNSNELPTAPKPKKRTTCDSANIPTLTPEYLKSLSAYIQEAKKAHKAATINLKDSPAVENSISKDSNLETNPIVKKKSISEESSELTSENEINKTNADADEQLNVEKGSQAENTKSNADAGEQVDTVGELNGDALESGGVQCKTVETDEREDTQTHVTNYEEAEAENQKGAEKKKNYAEKCEERENQQMETNVTKDAAEGNEKMDNLECNDVQCAADISELNNSDREENKSTEIVSSEENITQKLVAESEIPQIEADATGKNHDGQSEVVEEEKKDIIGCDERHSEGVDVEKPIVDQSKSTHCDTDEGEKMQLDESNGTKAELKLVAESETPQIEEEEYEVGDKEKLDFIDDDDELKLDSDSVYTQSKTNKECKVIEVQKMDLIDCDEEHREGVDIEKQTVDQKTATEGGIDQSDKMEVDESGGMQTGVNKLKDYSVTNDSNSTGNDDSIVLSENKSTNDSCSKYKDVNLDTGSKAPESEVNDEQKNNMNESKGTKLVGDESEIIKVVNSNSAHYEVSEIENKSIPESYATHFETENNKIDLIETKDTEVANDGNNVDVLLDCASEDTQTIPDMGSALKQTFNNVFSTCVISNKSDAFTQTNDSTITLIKNICAMRKKVRKQAEEIVSLNAAMKLLDTASLLKTFDN